MKRNALFLPAIIIVLIVISSCNPDRAGEAVIRSYEDQEGIITFKIPPGLVGMIISKDDPEMKEMFKNLKSLKIILADMSKVQAKDTRTFASEFEDKLTDSGFELMLRFTEDGSTIRLFSLEEEETVKEMLVLISGDNEIIGLSMTGNINQDAIIRASGKLKISDFNIE